MLSPTRLVPERRPGCPYCGHPVLFWPKASFLHACDTCDRPLVLLRRVADWNGPKRLRTPLDIAQTTYGLLTVGLLVAGVFAGMTPRQFAKGVAVLLFIIGSVLSADGVLGLTTGLDRTAGRLRSGTSAKWFAGAKLLAGIGALLLLVMGLAL